MAAGPSLQSQVFRVRQRRTSWHRTSALTTGAPRPAPPRALAPSCVRPPARPAQVHGRAADSPRCAEVETSAALPADGLRPAHVQSRLRLLPRACRARPAAVRACVPTVLCEPACVRGADAPAQRWARTRARLAGRRAPARARVAHGATPSGRHAHVRSRILAVTRCVLATAAVSAVLLGHHSANGAFARVQKYSVQLLTAAACARYLQQMLGCAQRQPLLYGAPPPKGLL
jgi:hypothetical protein